MLLSKSGLPLQIVEKNNELLFDKAISSDPVSVRTWAESVPFYENEKLPINQAPLYYMYRNVHRLADIEKIQASPFRYDITVVLPGLIGEEYTKTIGHLHPLSQEAALPYTYTEVYSVIYGTAHYILQRFSEDLTKITDVVDLIVHEGEHVFIPSFYGHVTVNVTDKPLVMANILFKNFVSNYLPYRNSRGAALYVKKGKDNDILLETNPSYANLPKHRLATYVDFVPAELLPGVPLYSQWIDHLSGFQYLYK